MFLLEALIAILVFSLGILGMIAMGSTAIASQSDAQYRTDAANVRERDRKQDRAQCRHDQSAGIDSGVASGLRAPADRRCGFCDFAGAASTSPIVLGWVDEVRGAVAGVPGLPGATNVSESIAVDTTQANVQQGDGDDLLAATFREALRVRTGRCW